jgi:hypothetical protein
VFKYNCPLKNNLMMHCRGIIWLELNCVSLFTIKYKRWKAFSDSLILFDVATSFSKLEPFITRCPDQMIPFNVNVGYISMMALSIILCCIQRSKSYCYYQGPAKTHNTKSVSKIVVIDLSPTCCPVARSNCWRKKKRLSYENIAYVTE